MLSEVVAGIEKGAFPLSAALAAGISKTTHYRMIETAASEKAPQIVRDYGTAIEKAKGRLAARYYATINEAALGHEKPMRWGNGDPVLEDEAGNIVFTSALKDGSAPKVLRVRMERVPGQWTAASRALESLQPVEFMRVFKPVVEGEESPEGGVTIIEAPSDRPASEMADIERLVAKKASGQ